MIPKLKKDLFISFDKTLNRLESIMEILIYKYSNMIITRTMFIHQSSRLGNIYSLLSGSVKNVQRISND